MISSRALRRSLNVMKQMRSICNQRMSCQTTACQSGSVPRYLSTAGNPPDDDDEDTQEALRILSDPDTELLRDVYMAKSGEELFTYEPGAEMNPDFDWADFERCFGLDRYTDEEIDDGWEQLQKKFNMETEQITEKSKGGISSTSAVTDATKEKSVIIQRKSPAEGVSLRHATAAADEIQDTAPSKHTISHPDAFRQPANSKRPGYERRVMSMEREMEKIVVDVLCPGNSEWYASGGDVDRVLLSPNMKNLTVYYTVDDDSSRSASWWRKTNSKCEGAIRSALAKTLETKYVPRVFLEPVKSNNNSDTKLNNAKELDSLFEQIAAEQDEAKRKAKDLPPE